MQSLREQSNLRIHQVAGEFLVKHITNPPRRHLGVSKSLELSGSGDGDEYGSGGESNRGSGRGRRRSSSSGT